MRRYLVLAVLMVVLGSCSSTVPVKHPEAVKPLSTIVPKDLQHIRYAGGNGLTPYDAVIILNANSSEDGVRAEYFWLSVSFPGARKIMQDQLQQGSQYYDAISLVAADGAEFTVYFDITRFVHKGLAA